MRYVLYHGILMSPLNMALLWVILTFDIFQDLDPHNKLNLSHFFIESISYQINYPSILWAMGMPLIFHSFYLVFFSICYQVYMCVMSLYVQGNSYYHAHIQVSFYLLCQPSLCQVCICISVFIVRYLILVFFLC